MKLVVGLGNPGPEYATTRHNIGFMAVDAWHDRWGFGVWQKKFHGLIADGVIDGKKILLLKPMTFMNRSGLAVGEVATFYKIAPDDIVVIHDEIELMPGKVRVKTGGGHAGHNGLKSIDAAVGADYRRVRLGVGRPPEGREAVHDYVLHAFAKADQVWLDPLLRTLAQEAALLLAGNDGEYMNRMVRALPPEKEKA
ncbi:MAG: aminoacyl-tRNA hydrolase [Alphaproteobacteria bacterium]